MEKKKRHRNPQDGFLSPFLLQAGQGEDRPLKSLVAGAAELSDQAASQPSRQPCWASRIGGGYPGGLAGIKFSNICKPPSLEFPAAEGPLCGEVPLGDSASATSAGHPCLPHLWVPSQLPPPCQGGTHTPKPPGLCPCRWEPSVWMPLSGA